MTSSIRLLFVVVALSGATTLSGCSALFGGGRTSAPKPKVYHPRFSYPISSAIRRGGSVWTNSPNRPGTLARLIDLGVVVVIARPSTCSCCIPRASAPHKCR